MGMGRWSTVVTGLPVCEDRSPQDPTDPQSRSRGRRVSDRPALTLSLHAAERRWWLAAAVERGGINIRTLAGTHLSRRPRDPARTGAICQGHAAHRSAQPARRPPPQRRGQPYSLKTAAAGRPARFARLGRSFWPLLAPREPPEA